jgi:YidC/Oxa1 family membrane protein insertase
MEKRVMIAVLLSIAVMYGYSFMFPQPQQQKPAVRQEAQGVSSSATVPQQGIAVIPAIPAVAESAARDVTVETDTFLAVFSSRGGTLKRLLLKQYRESAAPHAKEIALVAEEQPENYSLRSEATGFTIDPFALFTPSVDSLRLAKGERKSLTFSWRSPQGDLFSKSYTFTGDSFAVDLDQQIVNNSGARVDGVIRLALKNRMAAVKGDTRFEVYGPSTLADNAIQNLKIDDLTKGGAKLYSKDILWSGFGDKYFFNAVLSRNGSIAGAQVQERQGFVENVVSSAKLAVDPGRSLVFATRLYFGPKDLDILKAQGSRLEEVIDFGWFSSLAKPLLYSLKYFHRYTHNYGIDIIIITVILKLLFFPLTHKSYKSMKEMQVLQPKMAALKEKFKNDRDAMNKAVMELYKTNKVNPMSGCLPMLVQIPVFFALYKALMFSIELRHAPFMLWIHDLADKDPYYVTPVIMGVTMFIQTKMTPSQMDPMQQKVMLALPVVFTFMFLNFPSGLVLYWLVNNVLTIAQQAYINKSLGGAAPATGK